MSEVACSYYQKLTMTVNEIISRLKSMVNPENAAGMSKYGINPKNTLGIPAPVFWKLAKEIGRNHYPGC
ncbi:DNA alkylation repair protein [candidate division KSB1 bacterium]|nr:DNA alkylation repair protein [candidate division KSB1 bacterium]